MQITPELANTAAQDAGNRSMRKAGRKTWSADDWNAAVQEMDRLLLLMPMPILAQPGARIICAERDRRLAVRDAVAAGREV